MVTQSWLILLGAVLLKSTIFARSQKHLSFTMGFMGMIAGNVLTTIIGVIVAALIGSGPIIFAGALIVWPLCIWPARRILAAMNHTWLNSFSPVGMAFVMVLLLVASCFLFASSMLFTGSKPSLTYWLFKLAAVYLALIVSIVLTAFWEEWTVWKLSRLPAEFAGYVQPVIRANLVVLFCVMLFAAGVALPKRLKSPDFLINLRWLPHASLVANNKLALDK